VVAHFENAQTEERMALRKSVEIEEELVCWVGLVAEKEFSPARFGANMLRPSDRTIDGGAAIVERVLPVFDCSCEVEITAQLVRDAEVALLNAREHFGVKGFLKRFSRAQQGAGVGIFSFQVADNFGIFSFTEPGVFVDAKVTVKAVFDLTASGDGRLRIGVDGGSDRGRLLLGGFGVHFVFQTKAGSRLRRRRELTTVG